MSLWNLWESILLSTLHCLQKKYGFIHKKEAALVPPDLRDNLPVPCIPTANAARAGQLLSLVRAIDGQYVNSGASRLKNRMRR